MTSSPREDENNSSDNETYSMTIEICEADSEKKDIHLNSCMNHHLPNTQKNKKSVHFESSVNENEDLTRLILESNLELDGNNGRNSYAQNIDADILDVNNVISSHNEDENLDKPNNEALSDTKDDILAGTKLKSDIFSRNDSLIKIRDIFSSKTKNEELKDREDKKINESKDQNLNDDVSAEAENPLVIEEDSSVDKRISLFTQLTNKKSQSVKTKFPSKLISQDSPVTKANPLGTEQSENPLVIEEDNSVKKKISLFTQLTNKKLENDNTKFPSKLISQDSPVTKANPLGTEQSKIPLVIEEDNSVEKRISLFKQLTTKKGQNVETKFPSKLISQDSPATKANPLGTEKSENPLVIEEDNSVERRIALFKQLTTEKTQNDETKFPSKLISQDSPATKANPLGTEKSENPLVIEEDNSVERRIALFKQLTTEKTQNDETKFPSKLISQNSPVTKDNPLETAKADILIDSKVEIQRNPTDKNSPYEQIDSSLDSKDENLAYSLNSSSITTSFQDSNEIYDKTTKFDLTPVNHQKVPKFTQINPEDTKLEKKKNPPNSIQFEKFTMASKLVNSEINSSSFTPSDENYETNIRPVTKLTKKSHSSLLNESHIYYQDISCQTSLNQNLKENNENLSLNRDKNLASPTQQTDTSSESFSSSDSLDNNVNSGSSNLPISNLPIPNDIPKTIEFTPSINKIPRRSVRHSTTKSRLNMISKKNLSMAGQQQLSQLKSNPTKKSYFYMFEAATLKKKQKFNELLFPATKKFQINKFSDQIYKIPFVSSNQKQFQTHFGGHIMSCYDAIKKKMVMLVKKANKKENLCIYSKDSKAKVNSKTSNVMYNKKVWISLDRNQPITNSQEAVMTNIRNKLRMKEFLLAANSKKSINEPLHPIASPKSNQKNERRSVKTYNRKKTINEPSHPRVAQKQDKNNERKSVITNNRKKTNNEPSHPIVGQKQDENNERKSVITYNRKKTNNEPSHPIVAQKQDKNNERKSVITNNRKKTNNEPSHPIVGQKQDENNERKSVITYNRKKTNNEPSHPIVAQKQDENNERKSVVTFSTHNITTRPKIKIPVSNVKSYNNLREHKRKSTIFSNKAINEKLFNRKCPYSKIAR